MFHFHDGTGGHEQRAACCTLEGASIAASPRKRYIFSNRDVRVCSDVLFSCVRPLTRVWQQNSRPRLTLDRFQTR